MLVYALAIGMALVFTCCGLFYVARIEARSRAARSITRGSTQNASCSDIQPQRGDFSDLAAGSIEGVATYD